MEKSLKTKWKPISGELIMFVNIGGTLTTPRLKLFGIEKRKCRFRKEIPSESGYPFHQYSQNLCLMECSVEAAIKLCGCRPFFYKFGKLFQS